MTRKPVFLAALCAALLLSLSLVASAAPPAFTPPKPLHIGVGGDYPDGLDGVLTEYGLPHQRIFAWELADPEVLKRFEVLLLSCPVPTRGQMSSALTEWMKAGGRLYVEVWAGLQGSYPLQQLVSVTGAAPEHSDLLLTDPTHPLAAGLDTKQTIDLFHLPGVFVAPRPSTGGKQLAQFCYDQTTTAIPGGGALVWLPVGQGELLYTGAPLSFCRFHRSAGPELLLLAIFRELSQGRAVPRLTVLPPDRPAPTDTASPSAAEPAAPASTAVPAGFTFVDRADDGKYNLSAQTGPAGQDTKPTVLLLDGEFTDAGRARRPCLSLALYRDRLELREGLVPARTAVVATAKWQPPSSPAELLVRRRPGEVSVVVGETELLHSKTTLPLGGAMAVSAGAVPVTDAYCQPVGDPLFSDDFMRDTDEPLLWTPVAGQWTNVGVGNEGNSVNGFYLRGWSAETGLATIGEAYWENYDFSAAVRLSDGKTTCGLCALQQPGGDHVAFVADSTLASTPMLRLVRTRGGQETLLAQTPGGLAPQQWYRLALRVLGGKLEGLIDGRPAVESANPIPRGGAIGLLVRGGSARFDDVLVQPADHPVRSPHGEGSPAPELPVSLGPQDSLTWANPSAKWTASPDRPSLLWHEGDFPGEVRISLPLEPTDQPALRRVILAPSNTSPAGDWVSVTAYLPAGSKQATLTLSAPGKPSQTREVTIATGSLLAMAHRAQTVTVASDSGTVFTLQTAAVLRRVGLEVDGPPLVAQRLRVRAPEVRDYVFGAAPTDWWVSSGTWEVTARWACDNRWSWFAGWGSGDAAIWNKQPVQGDVVVEYFVGVKMEAPGGPETIRCRDLNAVLCGDQKDPRNGYSFILGGDDGVRTQLLRNGQVVAECPDIRVPNGYGIHHAWFPVRVAKLGSRIELDFDGRPVFRYDDPQPLPGGYVGLWTRDSGMLVPRVTIYR